MESRNVVVKVHQGELRGVRERSIYDQEFVAFRGVPYAKPPVGQLRFKDPEPAEGWTGIRDATKFGNVCTHFDVFLREIIGDDDCLYLNVYTSSIEVPRLRPVLVWIHGGGFLTGSGNDDLYGPDFLVRKDVVLVTINYRIGVLGFLNLEDEVAPGNQGLKDQVMALRWIRENISSFGGDPNNVTIFGESAGGASVHYLTLSPLANGLFHKAMSQSGVVTNPWACMPEEPRRYAFQLAANLGQKSTDPKTIVEFFRSLDSKALVKAQNKLITKVEDRKVLFPFGPGPDSKSSNPLLAQHPSLAYRFGVKVPYLMGYNTNEGSFLIRNPPDQTIEAIEGDFEAIVHPAVLASLKQEGIATEDLKRIYYGNARVSRENLEKYADYKTDECFLRGIFEVASVQMEKANTPTYFYHFKYDCPVSLVKKAFDVQIPGATHAEDLLYLFHPYCTKLFGIEPPQPGTAEYKIMEYFTEMWTNFAETGNPTPKKSELIKTIWEPFASGNVFKYLCIDEELKMETAEKGTQRFNWKKLQNKL